jgi:uncharacterized repeat protein (TIGR01451 family)
MSWVSVGRTGLGSWVGRVVVCVLVLCAWGVVCSSASAGVGWEATSTVFPTDLPPGGQGAFEVNVSNVGDTPSTGPITVTDVLPEGVTALEAGDIQEAPAEPISGELWNCSGIGTSVVTCTSNPETLPYMPYPFEGYYGQDVLGIAGVMEHIGIAVAVAPGAHGDNRVTVSGGGARGPASFSEPVVVSSQPAGFGFQDATVWDSNKEGEVDTQAGSHPYELGFSFDFDTAEGAQIAGGEVRDVEVRLPPGLVGNINAVPQCTRPELDTEECPVSTQIGVDTVNALADSYRRFPWHFPLALYNMVPPRGVTAQFGFIILGKEQFFDATVRSGGDYGITEHIDNAVQEQIDGNRVVLWGEPADPSHNLERNSGDSCTEGCPSGVASVEPFLTLGTSCAGAQAQEYSASMSAWGNQDTAQTTFFEDEASGAPTGLTGCENLAFGPAITISPDTSDADTPAGLTSDVKINQSGLVAQDGVAPSALREVTVTLPEGLVLNPGRAAGLQACTPAQSGLDSGEARGDETPPSCPLASQVGTVQVTSPLLPDKLEGAVYVLESEPPHVKLEIAASGDGVNVKLQGTVSLNERTGQMVARFPETPPLPFTDFKLAFTGGAQAALATPPGCGVYTTSVDFDPWATPFVEDTLDTSSFGVESGPGGSPCASPLPFTPQMTAGATTDQAGGYTDFTMLLTRGEDQQRISKLQFKTPEGLLGMISHVQLCEEPQAAKGECPAASQIGHTVVGAGAGPYPLFVPEPGRSPAPIYIGGPYEGAP